MQSGKHKILMKIIQLNFDLNRVYNYRFVINLNWACYLSFESVTSAESYKSTCYNPGSHNHGVENGDTRSPASWKVDRASQTSQSGQSIEIQCDILQSPEKVDKFTQCCNIGKTYYVLGLFLINPMCIWYTAGRIIAKPFSEYGLKIRTIAFACKNVWPKQN